MNFRDEMISTKGTIMTSREELEQRKIERKKYRKEDIEKVVDIFVDIIKESFRRISPEDEYSENWFGKRIYTNRKVLKTHFSISKIVFSSSERISYEKLDMDEYYLEILHADPNAKKIIEDKFKRWLVENGIIIENIKSWGDNGFWYDLKMYLN